MAAPNATPLAGRRVVVTRAPEQAGELIRELEQLGAQVLLLPAVAFSDPAGPAPLDQAIASFAQFDWLLFTSRNAVHFFAKRCRALGAPQAGKLGDDTLTVATRSGDDLVGVFEIRDVRAVEASVQFGDTNAVNDRNVVTHGFMFARLTTP